MLFQQLSDEDYKEINENLLAGKDTIDVLKWAYGTYQDGLVYACSFGAEGMVLIDLISKVQKNAQIVFLDTHLHFKETYELIEKVKIRYPDLRIEIVEPSLTLKQQKEEYGDELWKRNPDQCCHLRKIEPLKKLLSGYSAWITGLRREQSPTRSRMQYVNKDNKFQLVKICPLIYWTWEEVWDYIKLYNLPYNPLHDRGYPSIGCENCTQPVHEGGDLRAGRWSDFKKTECGLHQ
ncbi:phosphoadenylyl-sulfate reductase [Microaerobacter geothermalis]|uniref:phosphoadenylyl-sulfate reductase n=1 Tax=Microaerobacter geothermalis TaxID=674972 RepID=UPI001F32CB4E|nr:phosphoadenylyl-sulfate reductase [Microaerobacter geothermalis]MCF6094229.1 phosphoadenylyl-sulfate reductase [Microaerobacter geothermalis]